MTGENDSRRGQIQKGLVCPIDFGFDVVDEGETMKQWHSHVGVRVF